MNEGIWKRLAEAASERAPSPIYPRLVERVARALAATSDFWAVIDRANVPVVFAAAIIDALRQNGLVEVRAGRLEWTDAGRRLVAGNGMAPLPSYRCPACEGRGVQYPAEAEWVQAFLRYEKDRPTPRQEYDQGSVTPATTLARVAFLDQWGDLDGKDILVMGAEDDLMGLAVAFTRRARRVVILDIDERIIRFEHDILTREQIDNVEAQVFDLRNPFPAEWEGAFDVFITDPPETIPAFRAFIARGVSALREVGSSGYFGLTLRDSSLYRWQKFQRALVDDLGMVITDIIQNFSHYMNWEYHEGTRAEALNPTGAPPQSIWYKSAWYRIEALPGFRGINEPITDAVFESLYSDDEGVTT